jgi:hypothetical protein
MKKAIPVKGDREIRISEPQENSSRFEQVFCTLLLKLEQSQTLGKRFFVNCYIS